MALSAATTPLVIALTQGSADAFVQSSVVTGLSGRQAYNLRSIYIEVTSAVVMNANSEYEVALTRRSKTSMPTISDTDVIYKWRFQHHFTTSGAVGREKTNVFTFAIEMPIVEETLYAQLDSSATSAVQTAVVRLEVELDTMSDIDRLNLIARSLT